MSQRFDYVKYDEKHMAMQAEYKAKMLDLEAAIGKLPSSRASSLAMTKLEEVYMWIGKAIRDSQVASGGDASDKPHRTNE